MAINLSTIFALSTTIFQFGYNLRKMKVCSGYFTGLFVTVIFLIINCFGIIMFRQTSRTKLCRRFWFENAFHFSKTKCSHQESYLFVTHYLRKERMDLVSQGSATF